LFYQISLHEMVNTFMSLVVILNLIVLEALNILGNAFGQIKNNIKYMRASENT